MARVSYEIVRSADGWSLLRDGREEMSYATQEAAFESAAASASADLRSGFDIAIAASTPTDPAGASPDGGPPLVGDAAS